MSIRIEPFMTDRLALSGAELVVYAAIWSAGPRGAEFSTSMLAHACGISRKTASRARSALEGRGLIRKAAGPANQTRAARWVAPAAIAGRLPDWYAEYTGT